MTSQQTTTAPSREAQTVQCPLCTLLNSSNISTSTSTATAIPTFRLHTATPPKGFPSLETNEWTECPTCGFMLDVSQPKPVATREDTDKEGVKEDCSEFDYGLDGEEQEQDQLVRSPDYRFRYQLHPTEHPDTHHSTPKPKPRDLNLWKPAKASSRERKRYKENNKNKYRSNTRERSTSTSTSTSTSSATSDSVWSLLGTVASTTHTILGSMGGGVGAGFGDVSGEIMSLEINEMVTFSMF
ncbi:hypothetical protein BJY04DRAFT_214421 [Aspergillus karnatakaensis]|uniref:uncharacterized protein n=1 Tax=Aspergillus karnatakaensis TaxID=1810916 RepID=UPI003CCCDCBD